VTPGAALRAPDLIARKRDGGALDADELEWLIGGYLRGEVGEGQTAAFLMAGVLRGFNQAEAVALTEVLLASGEVLDLSGLAGPTIDKHSTGGVGDGTTLLVAPLLAAAGAQLVKLSGRGLGHTGGTLDKLESIPGLRTAREPDELLRIVADVGCVVAAQSDRLVPADRALYALRDVTATVESVALIASSVMSKKLAAGAETIVLDVKAGDGAFMRTVDEATVLAQLCVRIGVAAGRRCTALVTAMDTPLGRGIGNALEVAECIELLRSPLDADRPPRLAEVALELAAHALGLARGVEPASVVGELRDRWDSGEALERLRAMVAALGGDPRVCDDPASVLPAAPVVREVTAAHPGAVVALPARAVGEVAAALGAGRARSGDAVDPAVGVELTVEVGDRVDRGSGLARISARTDADADAAAVRLGDVILIGDADPVGRPATLLEVVGG
jgi:pyrimidine-nucleoside phosphorylase